ncbi:hypothetical protein [Nocardioides marmorisolisilvae]|nr:hypothetical protein [Nocardioides marmorisolisilvae]
MSDLGTALRELAGRQQPIDGSDAADLWSRGKQRVRRRRAIGAAVAAIVVAAVGLGAVLVPEPAVVMPAGEVHKPAYPERIYPASRWLATTKDHPLGQVAVVIPSYRGNKSSVYAISATTGEYRYLDLPGWVEGSHVSLAPDGKHLAYWTTGRTTQAPYPDPILNPVGKGEAIAGVAIYDTVTGKVQRTPLPTPHGMSDEPVYWVNNATMWFGDWRLQNRHSAKMVRSLSISVGRPEPLQIRDSALAGTSGNLNSNGTFSLSEDGQQTWEQVAAPGSIDPGFFEARPAVRLPVRLPEKHADGPVATYDYVATAGTRVVVVVDSTPSMSSPVLVGDIDKNGAVKTLDFVGDRFQEADVVGWRDASTLLAYGRDRHGAILAAVDVPTRKLTVLTRSISGWSPDMSPARDVLAQGLVTGLRPPEPMDPRLRNGLIAGGGLVLAGAVLVLVRRRRRA